MCRLGPGNLITTHLPYTSTPDTIVFTDGYGRPYFAVDPALVVWAPKMVPVGEECREVLP